jgi:hypothetical protein
VTQTTDLFGPDWADVVRRSRRSRRRLWGLQAAAVAALVAAGIASAYALGHPVIDFGKATHAGVREVDDFGSMQVAAPVGMAPGVLPHQTRRITSIRIDGKVHTLYVAPTRQGGFCDEWTGLGGGCRANRHDKFASRIGTGGLEGRNGPLEVDGSFFQQNGARLTMSFKDGSTADVPFVWVTAPINAGFYAWRVPDAYRKAATRPVSLALYDANGKLIDREPIMGGGLPPVGPVVHVQGFSGLMVPRAGIWAKAKMLFDLRAPNGARVGLWTMPKRGGGECYLTNTGSGCLPASRPKGRPLIALGFYGDRICCQVSTRIARVQALFQDGAQTWLYPKEGFLIWPIPADHYALGHRLVALIGYDASGRAIARAKLPSPAAQRGVYPCKKPKKLGYGVTMCQ